MERPGYLPGLDGLRAFAVGAVLLFHAGLGWMPGGFLGVDVFFVISGYLITSLLLAEHARSGTISLRSFWLRRARRLLPALYAMLAVLAMLASLFYRSTLADLRSQLVPALTYWSNWYLIGAHHSYFAIIGRPPLLQHLWSLAVEEQFYLIWPVVLLLLLRALGGSLRRVATAVGAGALASVILMVVLHPPMSDPSRVYYGADTRMFELLLGALLAVGWRAGFRPNRYRALHRRGHTALLDRIGMLALAGTVGCFFVMNDSQSGLYPGGLLVVSLLTLTVIASVVHPTTEQVKGALSHRALIWTGKRSYGIYLWHWPIFAVTRPGIDVPQGAYLSLAVRLLLTFGAAAVSYRYIEQPIRRAGFKSWVSGLRVRHLVGPGRPARTRALTIVGTGLVVVFVIYSLAVAKRPVSAAERSIRSSQGASPVQPVPNGGSLASFSRPQPETMSGTAAPVTNPTDPKTVTVITDSVLFGARQTFLGQLGAAGWQVDYRGRVAMTIKREVDDLRKGNTPVGSVAVVGLGYNSTWQRNRVHYKIWSDAFDADAENLVATLKQLGAKTVVWVTLREPSPDVVPLPGRAEYELSAWYFPYVNERLHALQQRHPEILLADWAAISNRPGITYDSIHLNPDGARLMTNLVRTTLGI